MRLIYKIKKPSIRSVRMRAFLFVFTSLYPPGDTPEIPIIIKLMIAELINISKSRM